MSITLTYSGTTVTLPADTLWIDRHSWSPVEQTVSTSITGAAIVDVGTRLNGRPVTLVSDAEHAWIPYSDISQIKAWADVPGRELTLGIDGITLNVMFRHQDKPAVDVQPVIDYATPAAQDWFFGTLKFTEI